MIKHRTLPEILEMMRDFGARYWILYMQNAAGMWAQFDKSDSDLDDPEEAVSSLAKTVDSIEESAPGSEYRITIRKAAQSHGGGERSHIYFVANTTALKQNNPFGGMAQHAEGLGMFGQIVQSGFMPTQMANMQATLAETLVRHQYDLMLRDKDVQIDRMTDELSGLKTDLRASKQETADLRKALENKVEQMKHVGTEVLTDLLLKHGPSLLKMGPAAATPGTGLGSAPQDPAHLEALFAAIRAANLNPAEAQTLAASLPQLLSQLRPAHAYDQHTAAAGNGYGAADAA